MQIGFTNWKFGFVFEEEFDLIGSKALVELSLSLAGALTCLDEYGWIFFVLFYDEMGLINLFWNPNLMKRVKGFSLVFQGRTSFGKFSMI